ncbi:LysR family transcriptional regulator [Xanthomonas massiliensis]|uniref:LysR family transcriptional regulator n=1 Tax=Xanthomonas massiliensis TaxID=1720302 RepID=UPI001917FFB3|nr:LysR family transcriptional regulator [Xanthomonas massiliensis]
MRAFVAVARAGGFREAARVLHASTSGLSDAVRRLEARLGVRLLHRTTRSVRPTEQGQHLLERAGPAFAELEQALQAASSAQTGEQPNGSLRLNVPVNLARLYLPTLLPRFMQRYPGIAVEVMADSRPVDILAAGCDAGIRYEERLAQDMIAVPIGPRRQRFATAAAPAYLDRHGRPQHPRDLLSLRGLRCRFANGSLDTWSFQRGADTCEIEPPPALIYSAGTAVDLGVAAALAGEGVIHLFEEWLRPQLDRGTLEPVLAPWWQWFPGPYLYYSGRQLLPAPLRAFIDFVKAEVADS